MYEGGQEVRRSNQAGADILDGSGDAVSVLDWATF